MVRYTGLTEEQKQELLFTSEELKQLDEASKKPIVYDTDCPAVTPEKAVKFRRAKDAHHKRK